MFRVTTLLLFLMSSFKAAEALIYQAPMDTPILCPNEPELPWQVNNEQCSSISHQQAAVLLDATYGVVLNHDESISINLNDFLSPDEKADYQSIQDLITPIVYNRIPKKMQVQPSRELHENAKAEVQTICDAVLNKELELSSDDLDEDGCVALPLTKSNILFDGTNYPYLHAFMNLTRNSIEARFACLNSFTESTRFHIDATKIVSVTTDATISTRIITNAILPAINLERFNLKQRMLDAFNKDVVPFTFTAYKHHSLSARKASALKERIDEIVMASEQQMEKEVNLVAADRWLTRHLKNAQAPQVTYLPSGEIYNLNQAVHDGPVKDPNNHACRVVFFN